MKQAHPVWHLVRVLQAVVVVEDKDGGYHAAGHHQHDRIEICSCNSSVLLDWGEH